MLLEGRHANPGPGILPALMDEGVETERLVEGPFPGVGAHCGCRWVVHEGCLGRPDQAPVVGGRLLPYTETVEARRSPFVDGGWTEVVQPVDIRDTSLADEIRMGAKMWTGADSARIRL